MHLLRVHLVFTTKYRRGAISDRVRDDLRTIFSDVCADFGCELVEADGEDDHMHLLVGYPPKVALSRLVASLKGVSARRIRAKGYPEVRRALWGDHLWSPSYCAVSCGEAPLETVAAYIRDQRLPNKGPGGREGTARTPTPPTTRRRPPAATGRTRLSLPH